MVECGVSLKVCDVLGERVKVSVCVSLGVVTSSTRLELNSRQTHPPFYTRPRSIHENIHINQKY